MDRIDHALARVARYGNRAGLLCLDINTFRSVNESLGLDVGDQVLREAGQRIQSSLREMDTAARMGDDEFVVVLQDIEDADEAVSVGERIRKSLGRPFAACGTICRELVVSIGISVCPEHGTTVDALLKKADQAMYRAKRHKQGGVALWEDLLVV